MVQTRSWKIDENIFHQKCPKQHSLVTENVSGDASGPVTSKIHDFSFVFMVSDYCGASYSKCMHCGSALQKRALLVRARSQK